MVRKRASRTRIVITSLVVLVLVAAIAYIAFGYFIYNSLAKVTEGCNAVRVNRPDHIELLGGKDSTPWPEIDVTPYLMPHYETVNFPSRQTDMTISGWYVAGDEGAPAIIVIEGVNSCKYAPAALIPAGMLHRNGFNVLLIDPRDMGDSTVEDGLTAIGNEEYADLLGAWDWLGAEKGFAPEQIGVYGNSLGAATVLVSFESEPRMAAIFLNSPFSNLSQIIGEELVRNGYPRWLAPSAIIAARLFGGDDLLAHNPEDALRAAGSRPVFITHSRADERINVRHSEQLMAVAAEAGVDATVWFVDDAAHIRNMAAYPQEFEERLVAFFEEALAQ